MERLSRIAKPLFWAALIFAYVAAILPQDEAPKLANSDKVEHMLAFFTLGVLARLAYRSRSWHGTALLLAAFGAFIEFTQMIPALHRDADIMDWVADVSAVGAAICLTALSARMTRARR